jgi:hypothetical protein
MKVVRTVLNGRDEETGVMHRALSRPTCKKGGGKDQALKLLSTFDPDGLYIIIHHKSNYQCVPRKGVV